MKWTPNRLGSRRKSQTVPPSDLLARLIAAPSLNGAPSSDFDLNKDVILPEGRKLRRAAVLVAILEHGDGPQLLLTKRSSRLKHHPGQIAFPGGKKDETDPTLEAAALREAREEVGLEPSNTEIIGTLPPHETVTGFSVTPVLARIRDAFDAIPEMGEVDEVFFVPLRHVADPQNFCVESRHWQGHRRYYFTVPYGPYYIWGATARILRGLADRMGIV